MPLAIYDGDDALPVREVSSLSYRAEACVGSPDDVGGLQAW